MVIAALVVVLVGFTSSVALIFAAAQAAGANEVMITSWVAALCFGSGLSGLWLSWRYQIPVITAWSTPGAALLITVLPEYGYGEAIGAFLVCALLIFLSGVSGIFARFMDKIPQSISAAMLAGILVPFGLKVFATVEALTWLPLILFLAWLFFKRYLPKYNILMMLIVGLLWLWGQGSLDFSTVTFALSKPVFTAPEWSLSAIVSVALPLFIVTMTSQNLPGISVMRAAAYPPPVSAALTATGGLNILIAPFGGFAINLAAITAALAMGDDVHPDKNKRYIAGIWTGIFYVLVAVFASLVVSLLTILPTLFIAVLAGIALIPTIINSLTVTTNDGESREAAVITFLVTASGMTLWGIGSAFWGIVVGMLVWFWQKR